MRSLKNFSLVVMLCLSGIYMYSCKPDVNSELVAQFSMSRRIAVIGDTIRFTNESKNYTGLSWDFGDGKTSADNNPTYSYSSEGTFYPKVIVNKKDKTKEISLKLVIVAPHNEILVSDTLIIAGQELLFSTLENTQVIWKINEVLASESESLKKSFTDPGEYKVEIFHPSAKMLLDEIIISVKAAPVAQTSKMITLNIVPLSAYVGEIITYSTNSLRPVLWDFGTETSEEINGKIEFSKSGNYTIKLTDKETGELIKSKTIVILEKLEEINFSSWLSDLANNKLSRNEKNELSKKVFSYCMNNGNIPITGRETGLFKDFVTKIRIEANPYELVTINVNYDLNSDNKITSIQLVTYNKKAIDN